MNQSLTAVALHPADDPRVYDLIEGEARSHPDWADLQNRWGLQLLASGEVDAARDAFSRSLDLNPRYGWAGLNLAAAFAMAGDPAAARSVAQDAFEPAPPARAVTEGWIAVLEGRADVGEAALLRIPPRLQSRPDVCWLTAAIAEIGDPARGAELWKRFIAGPEVSTWFGEVEVLRANGNGGRRAGLFPGFHQLWLETSRLQARHHDHEHAARAARLSYIFWSDRGCYLNHQGLLFALQGREEQAARFYREAMHASPGDATAPMALAFHAASRGDIDTAVYYLQIAVDRAPGYADLHRQLGLLETARGNLDTAAVAFQRALDINPLYAVARLDLGHALFRAGDHAAAAAAYERVLAAGIRSADVLLHLGRCRERLGRIEEAENAYREAVSLEPTEAAAHYRLGLLLRNRGRREEAKACWRRFMELGSDPERFEEVESLFDGRHFTDRGGHTIREER